MRLSLAWKVLSAALASFVATPAVACRGPVFNIVEQQRVQVKRQASAGDVCRHSFNRRDLGVAEIKVVRRPTQGRIEPAESGRGSYVYRSNRSATGADRYVIRAEFDRINPRTGESIGKTWTEVEFTVTFDQ